MKRIVTGTVVLFLLVPAVATGGSLGLDLGRGRGLFQGVLPSLRQGLLLSYDSKLGSSAMWWGRLPLRPRNNLEVNLVVGAHLDGLNSATWLPGVELTWRPSEHFLLSVQWSTFVPVRRWPALRAGSGDGSVPYRASGGWLPRVD